MSDRVLDDISHRRYNVLRGTWVLVSPHRTKRPWQGQQEAPTKTTLPDYDESCYLCPGNRRAQGDVNPDYDSTFVFVNDYSAVKENQVSYEPDRSDAQYLLKAEPVKGKCYVLTFSRFHNLTLADLPTRMIVPIVKCWTQIYAAHLASGSELSANTIYQPREPEAPNSAVSHTGSQYRYMQIFENKGAAMGCSNPHPHGQVWTTSTLPEEPAAELSQLMKYRKEHNGSHMLVDYANIEINRKERIVFENAHFLACCPWWATWPYEVMILSKANKRALVDFSNEEEFSLAECLADVTRRYDNLFETHFPYSMGIHQAPLTGTAEEINASHFHIHFYPPLLRSASVRKFLVGYELMAEPQRDITPEQAAARLRTCGGELYRQKSERGE